MVGRMRLSCQWTRAFFVLSGELLNVRDQAAMIFNLVHYGGFDYKSVIDMPVFERKFMHKKVIEALKEAGETRFIPIVLTTATTVGGLLPLTLGGGTMWAPMGWTIIGGLLFSTFLTLVVVPVLYKIYTK